MRKQEKRIALAAVFALILLAVLAFGRGGKQTAERQRAAHEEEVQENTRQDTAEAPDVSENKSDPADTLTAERQSTAGSDESSGTDDKSGEEVILPPEPLLPAKKEKTAAESGGTQGGAGGSGAEPVETPEEPGEIPEDEQPLVYPVDETNEKDADVSGTEQGDKPGGTGEAVELPVIIFN